MKAMFTSLIVCILIFVSLGALVLPTGGAQTELRTLYIGYHESDSGQPEARIDRIAKTFHFGVKPPFVPVCVVELRIENHEYRSVDPIFGKVLWSDVREDRSMVVRLIDGEDREEELRYWHLPSQHSGNTKDTYIQDIEQQVKDLDLPDGMGDGFSEQMNSMLGIGEAIGDDRREEMVSLAVDALRASEFDWAGDLLESRKVSWTTGTSSGFGGIVVYAMISFMIAILFGLICFVRLRK
ncbi:MAG: hypothetical protein JJ916_09135 [Phycisphaerales bacterium]|nr:hypothetical protein [Phycisphaerales bacterium]